jgi:hypothetical protein
VGLAGLKQAAQDFAQTIHAAAGAYDQTDREIADRINVRMHPDKDHDRRPGVQAVDWKHAPTPSPEPEPATHRYCMSSFC